MLGKRYANRVEEKGKAGRGKSLREILKAGRRWFVMRLCNIDNG